MSEALKPYTVLLLRPDYVADDYGTDTFHAHVLAVDVQGAMLNAQYEAVDADTSPHDYLDSEKEKAFSDMKDYAVLAVYEGHLNDIKEDQTE